MENNRINRISYAKALAEINAIDMRGGLSLAIFVIVVLSAMHAEASGTLSRPLMFAG